MRSAHVRALFVALVISVAMPAPIASGAPPAGRGPGEAVNPDLQRRELTHRGRAVPATKDRTANPARAIGLVRRASVEARDLVAAAEPAGVDAPETPPAAEPLVEPGVASPSGGLVPMPGPAAAAPTDFPTLPTPGHRLIRGSQVTGQGLINVSDQSPGAWVADWTPGTATTRSGVVIDYGNNTHHIEFWSAVGQTLAVGAYNPATHFSSGGVPAFTIRTSGIGPGVCHPATGDFVIHELTYTGNNLMSFAADIRFRCGTGDFEYAIVRYQSQLAWRQAEGAGVRHEFHQVPVATTSDPGFSTIWNYSTDDVVLGTASLTGDDEVFTLANDECSGTTLAPNGHCNVSVTFEPDAPMAATATLSFATDGATSSVSIALLGWTKVEVTYQVAGAPGEVEGCLGTCTFGADFGTQLTIDAIDGGIGSVFDHWSGGICSGSDPSCPVQLSGTSALFVGNFVDAYLVLVDGLGIGMGTVTSNPAGISCPDVCGVEVPLNTPVTLTWNPGAGLEFLRWGGACSGSGGCTVNSSVAGSTKLVTVLLATTLADPAGLIGTTPSLRTTGGFAGVGDDVFRCHDRPCMDPPDPSIAVGPSHIVVATTDGIRVSDRSGTTLADYFLWDFFLEDDGQAASFSPRVIYDQASGRWLASQVSTDCENGTTYIGVSAGTNPMGAWDIYVDAYAGLLPLDPGLGRSADKVALAVELWSLSECELQSLAGSSLTVIDRSTLLATPDDLAIGALDFDASWRSLKPAVAAGGGNDLWLVAGYGSFGSYGQRALMAGRITGTVAASTAKVVHPGSTTAGLRNLSEAQNATGLGQAYGLGSNEGGISAAVSYGSAVWFVATNYCRPTPLGGEMACVRVTKVGPSGVEDEFALGTALGPTFGGGIGMSGNGTLYLTYNQTTASSPWAFSAFSTYRLLGDPAGKVHPPARVATGAVPATGASFQDWSEFVGVASDPTDPTSVWYSQQVADGLGWKTWVERAMPATAAASGTLTINNGAASTTSPLVTLKVTPAAGSNATEALISNSPTLNGAVLAKHKRVPLGIQTGWSLTASTYGGTNATGARKVYVQFGRGNGGWSAPISATITFTSVKVSRLSGADRYATAAAVSAATYAPGVQVAYVSTGTAFAEPLVGAPLAGWLRGPLLLTPATTLAPATATELQRLKPRFIVVVGPTGVVSDAVMNAMAKYATSGYVFRDSGADKFETAAVAAVNTYAPGVPIVYVAWVGNFPDALAAAAAAGKQGAPILFTNTGNTPDITQAALAYLAPEKIFVVGGTGVINQSNYSFLSGFAPQTFRLAGADRFATAVAISKATYGPGVDVAYIAYGYNFPDALAGAAAAGYRGGPVLLTNSTTLHPATAAELTRLKPKRIVVLGGTGVISNTVFNQLAAYATGP